MKILISVLLFSIIFICVLIRKYMLFPAKDTIEITYPQEWVLSLGNNYYETQKRFECAGYATAYLLRSFGIPAKGNDIYKCITNKLPFGLVLPKSIITYLIKNNYNAKYYHGSLETLKSRLQIGKPLIVFIRVFKDKDYYHFLPVIGYTQHSLLFAESLDFLQNNGESVNREIENNAFLELWKLGIPFHSHTYIAIESES